MERRCANLNQIRILVVIDKIVKEHNGIKHDIYSFYQRLISENKDISGKDVLQYI